MTKGSERHGIKRGVVQGKWVPGQKALSEGWPLNKVCFIVSPSLIGSFGPFSRLLPGVSANDSFEGILHSYICGKNFVGPLPSRAVFKCRQQVKGRRGIAVGCRRQTGHFELLLPSSPVAHPREEAHL